MPLGHRSDQKVHPSLPTLPQACRPNAANVLGSAIPASDPPPNCPLAHLVPKGMESGNNALVSNNQTCIQAPVGLPFLLTLRE